MLSRDYPLLLGRKVGFLVAPTCPWHTSNLHHPGLALCKLQLPTAPSSLGYPGSPSLRSVVDLTEANSLASGT